MTIFFITLQAMKNLDDTLTTCRVGDLVFRVPLFVPHHEEWRGSNNNLYTVGDRTRLETIDHIKETQNECHTCKSEDSSDR